MARPPLRHDVDCASRGDSRIRHRGIGGVLAVAADVSADLTELARTPNDCRLLAARRSFWICRQTREWLETNSFTVAGYQCDEMPASIRKRVVCRSMFVAILRKRSRTSSKRNAILMWRSALLVTVPVPSEAEVEQSFLNKYLRKLSVRLNAKRLAVRELTPFCSRRCHSEVTARHCAPHSIV